MLITKKISPFIFCLLLFFSSINQVWSQSIEKQAVLAALTLNIARFTTWPDDAFDNNAEVALNLCVFGDNIVQQSFANIDNKVINSNSKTIHIIHISRLRNLKQCQLLYLSKLSRNRLSSLLTELKGQPILTVGENMGFIRVGGMIGLEKNNGKIQLTINLPVVKQSELIISSRLLKLANIVNFSIATHKTLLKPGIR